MAGDSAPKGHVQPLALSRGHLCTAPFLGGVLSIAFPARPSLRVMRCQCGALSLLVRCIQASSVGFLSKTGSERRGRNPVFAGPAQRTCMKPLQPGRRCSQHNGRNMSTPHLFPYPPAPQRLQCLLLMSTAPLALPGDGHQTTALCASSPVSSRVRWVLGVFAQLKFVPGHTRLHTAKWKSLSSSPALFSLPEGSSMHVEGLLCAPNWHLVIKSLIPISRSAPSPVQPILHTGPSGILNKKGEIRSWHRPA